MPRQYFLTNKSIYFWSSGFSLVRHHHPLFNHSQLSSCVYVDIGCCYVICGTASTSRVVAPLPQSLMVQWKITLNSDAFGKGHDLLERPLSSFVHFYATMCAWCTLQCKSESLLLIILWPWPSFTNFSILRPRSKAPPCLQHLTFSSALSQQQLLCWCCSLPLLFEAPFPTVTGQDWSMTCMTTIHVTCAPKPNSYHFAFHDLVPIIPHQRYPCHDPLASLCSCNLRPSNLTKMSSCICQPVFHWKIHG